MAKFSPGYPKMIYKSLVPMLFEDHKQLEVALEGKQVQTRIANNAAEEASLSEAGWTAWLEDFIKGAVRAKQPEDILAEATQAQATAIARADAAEAELAAMREKLAALEAAAAAAETAAGRKK